MSTAYRAPSRPYPDSLRSAQSNSIYSEDSSYLENSPLDSIIRDYPLVPGASPNAFKFSPVSYGSTPRTGSSVVGTFQQAQQQTRGAEAPLRLREQTADEYSDAPTPRQGGFSNQVQERPGSSPLLHAQFNSPSQSPSDDTRDARGSRNDGKSQDNFIDLRDSGSYTPPEHPPADHPQPSMQYFTHSRHGVPPRSDHGVTSVVNFGPRRIPSQPDHLTSRFSPMTPDAEGDVVLITPTGQSPQPQNNGKTAYAGNLHAAPDDYFNRGSWQTQSSAANPARETWMTTTSGVTVADPFSFRHYETPQASPNDQARLTAGAVIPAPAVVVHRPISEVPSEYTGRGDYVEFGQAMNTQNHSEDSYAIIPPSPTEPVPQGRMPSKVPVTTRYNFSRPLRNDASVDRSSAAPSTGASARGSEYSTMSTSTDLPHTIMGFPEPPIPSNLPPSMLSTRHNDPNDPPLTRRAIARMSIPKTVPNPNFKNEFQSPSPETRELALPGGSPMLQPTQLGTLQGHQNSFGSRSLSPIPDTERSSSPSSTSHGSSRFNAPSPVPGPPRTYEVPYSYHVTITDHQVQLPSAGYDNPSSQNNHTRYSVGGTAHPPAPRGVAALRSSPPPVGPRPGSSLSAYSRYSFYSVGDLPDSAAPTPKGWEKERSRQGGKSSPARSDSTPTPTNDKGKSSDDYHGLPYLDDIDESVPNAQPPEGTTMSPQEALLLGISHHEANRLQESAYWFERAATEHGGCGVGMLMWGLSLRHAWGVEKDERAAFWWLKRAAGCAVEDMERSRQMKERGVVDAEVERDRKAVQSELVLAVYEVGQCFFHGWGVETDKKLAVSYFQVAARLGDVDAQLELGFCFANGKGCKKDLKEAARWYRAAVAQGASNVGLAWIYKSKYGGDTASKEEEHPVDKNGRVTLPSSKGSSASVKSGSGKSESPRKLRKPPPRSKTPNGRGRSPARTDTGSHIDSP